MRTLGPRMRFIFPLLAALHATGMGIGEASAAASDFADPDAVAAVLAGEKTEARASWWGFDPEDATEALQAAIDSGAPRVVVPYVGSPWIVRPIRLRGGLELVFEPGVLVLAKRGEFRGKGDSLFRAVDATDVVVRGYGATLRMWKKDYQSAPYEKAEWRMGLAFVGCKRVRVEGVRIENSGGDGIYIGSSGKTVGARTSSFAIASASVTTAKGSASSAPKIFWSKTASSPPPTERPPKPASTWNPTAPTNGSSTASSGIAFSRTTPATPSWSTSGR